MKPDSKSINSKNIEIFTDGSSSGNPGPGGWAALIRKDGKTRELSGGYRRTTNNRMELMAVICALETVQGPSDVDVYSDSSYLVNSINKGWLQKWQKKGWVRTGNQPVPNADLWKKLLTLLKEKTIHFHWVEGHAGHPENERADRLAVQAGSKASLPVDAGYESLKEQTEQLNLFSTNQSFPLKTVHPAESSLGPLSSGKPCRKCGGLLVKKIPTAKRRPQQKYYYAYYYSCSKCGTNYFTDDARREI